MYFRNINNRITRSRRLSWRNLRERKIVLFIATAVLLYIEIFDTLFIPWLWSSKKCPGCLRVLVVADPQILGEHDEHFFFRWDSDRYLSKWYAAAFSHVSPDMVLFLGDIMDEGSRATDDEFQRYTNRFFYTFPVKQNVKYLYIPGDNDIGGELGEPIYPHIVKRFFQTFENTTAFNLGSVLFLKVNVPLEIPSTQRNPSIHTNMTILLSHFPLLSLGTYSKTPFSVKGFRPNIVLSAHSHFSELRNFGQYESTFLDEISLILKSNLELEELIEISVPTCSYRMGVNKTGYGNLVIDPARRELFYSVLWLPNRFTQIRILAGLGVFLLIYCLLFCCRFLKH